MAKRPPDIEKPLPVKARTAGFTATIHHAENPPSIEVVVEFQGTEFIDFDQTTPVVRDFLAYHLQQHLQYTTLRELTALLASSTTDLAAALQESAAAVVPSVLRKRVSTMAPQVLADLAAEVTDAKTVMAGAAAVLRGITARIEAAVAAAITNGATAEELAPLTDLVTDLDTATADLTAAIVEGTAAEGEEPAA